MSSNFTTVLYTFQLNEMNVKNYYSNFLNINSSLFEIIQIELNAAAAAAAAVTLYANS